MPNYEPSYLELNIFVIRLMIRHFTLMNNIIYACVCMCACVKARSYARYCMLEFRIFIRELSFINHKMKAIMCQLPFSVTTYSLFVYFGLIFVGWRYLKNHYICE